MEVVVPGAVGILVALCVEGLTGASRDSEAAASDTVPGAFGDIRRWLREVGGVARKALADGRASSWVLGAADEAVRLVGGRRFGRDAAGGDEALGAVLIACALSGFAGGIVFGVPSVLACAPVPVLALLGRRRRRARREALALEEGMPEAFGALAISLGSGHSLPQAMRFVGERSREPVRTEFMRVSLATACGVPAIRALDEMLGRLKAPALDLVVLALKISKRTGAPLDEMLAEAASMVDDRLDLRRRLDVKTSQARMSARMVAAMPLAMVAVLSVISGDFRRGLATPAGASAVAVAAVLDGAAWFSIKRIMRVGLEG